MEFIQLCGGHPVRLFAYWQGANLVVSLSGGVLEHVGSVALAQPRKSLADAKKISATASVF